MSEHLDKARAALADARAMEADLTAATMPPLYSRLLDVAQVQAWVAMAGAIERLADVFEAKWPLR